MSINTIESPYPIFAGADGKPLDDGNIYIGEPNQNPEIVPVSAYWNSGLTIPATQPIKTIGGYPSRSGTASRLYVEGDYSVTVRDKHSILIFTAPLATNILISINSLTTMSDLIGYTTAPDNTTINILGYYSVNDDGGGLFNWDSTVDKSNANAGTIIDPSVSLANQGTGVGLGCWVRQYSGAINVKWFGAVGDGITDDSLAIQNAIDSININGGKVYVNKGEYLLESELVLGSYGVELCGESISSFTGQNKLSSTVFISNSTIGSVIRIKAESCSIRNITISSTSTRKNATIDKTQLNYNCGIRVEADDSASPANNVYYSNIENVLVINQPSDGIALIGAVYGSEMTRAYCNDNNSHGLVLSNGEYNSRVNTTIAGIVTINDSSWTGNNGHGVLAGGISDTDYTFRLIMNNCEGFANGFDDLLLIAQADSYYNCDGLSFNSGACSGDRKTGAPTTNYSGVAVRGNGGTFLEVRFLHVTQCVEMVVSGVQTTKGWRIINPHVRESVESYIALLDPAVENVTVYVGDTISSITDGVNIYTPKGLSSTVAGNTISNIDTQFTNGIKDQNGLEISSKKINNQNVGTTPIVILDAAKQGMMWSIYVMHDSSTCLSSCTATVVGGATPVVSNLVNQVGASVTYDITVNGTNIELTATSDRNTDIYIKENIFN